MFCCIAAHGAQSASLAWDPVKDTNVTGYALYYGNASGNYSSRLDVGTNTTTTLSGLTNGLTYYFVATAYNSAKVESTPSNEARVAVPNNNPPVLAAIASQSVRVFDELVVTNVATDPNPASRITFSLDPGAPAQMTIDPASGLLDWVPGLSDAGTTNSITVRVTDNAVPPQSALQTFTITVGNYIGLNFGTSVVSLGQTSSVAIAFNSSTGVTNLSFTLDVPGDRMTNLSVQSLVPLTATITQSPAGAAHSLITMRAVSGQALQGSLNIAQINFKAVPNKHSSFAVLRGTNIVATQANGQAVPSVFGACGKIVLVGTESLVDSGLNTNGQPTLLLYGPSGSNYVVEARTSISGAWSTALPMTTMTTNLCQTFSNVISANSVKFYRARGM